MVQKGCGFVVGVGGHPGCRSAKRKFTAECGNLFEALDAFSPTFIRFDNRWTCLSISF